MVNGFTRNPSDDRHSGAIRHTASTLPGSSIPGTMNLASPVIDRVAFHVDRLRVSGAILTLSGLAALFAYAVVANPASGAGSMDLIARLLTTVGAIALISTALVLCISHLFRRGPIVTIDERGVQDRRIGGYILPWQHIQDVRFLDDTGGRIGIDVDATTVLPARRAPLRALLRLRPSNPMPVIDTFFLRSICGNRMLDFLIPMTAFADIDLVETPVSPEAMRMDARIARQHEHRIAAFATVAILLPALASGYLVAS
jgi:hypothetical protein